MNSLLRTVSVALTLGASYVVAIPQQVVSSAITVIATGSEGPTTTIFASDGIGSTVIASPTTIIFSGTASTVIAGPTASTIFGGGGTSTVVAPGGTSTIFAGGSSTIGVCVPLTTTSAGSGITSIAGTPITVSSGPVASPTTVSSGPVASPTTVSSGAVASFTSIADGTTSIVTSVIGVPVSSSLADTAPTATVTASIAARNNGGAISSVAATPSIGGTGSEPITIATSVIGGTGSEPVTVTSVVGGTGSEPVTVTSIAGTGFSTSVVASGPVTITSVASGQPSACVFSPISSGPVTPLRQEGDNSGAIGLGASMSAVVAALSAVFVLV
ncbi:hypothetical protein VNI00_012040 [Paramarasmius palmivorus]|uniref:Uncharacterized protein n=1 Tax=Paramarasmius palmivorus TaxID=297713 RepID=A0AAW0C8R7_9AGAR